MLGVHDLTLPRGGRTVLHAVTARWPAGCFAALVGPNGAGKTTLLSCLAGELPTPPGTITLDGRALEAWDPEARARRVAVLPQRDHLSFPFEVHEVVTMGRHPHLRGREGADDREAVEHAMERAGVTALARRVYTTLSGGERQRVQLARVLAQIGAPEARDDERLPSGRVVLLDEPVASLDPSHQHRVLEVGRDLARDGVTVVASLHDLDLAFRYADDVLLLAEGAVVAQGAPVDVLTSRRTAEVFDVSTHVVRSPSGRAALVTEGPSPRPEASRGARAPDTSRSASASPSEPDRLRGRPLPLDSLTRTWIQTCVPASSSPPSPPCAGAPTPGRPPVSGPCSTWAP